MVLSGVQGDHSGDAGAEDESLPASRASRKSSAAPPLGVRLCKKHTGPLIWLLIDAIHSQ